MKSSCGNRKVPERTEEDEVFYRHLMEVYFPGNIPHYEVHWEVKGECHYQNERVLIQDN